jgi:dienelactone hydrolase
MPIPPPIPPIRRKSIPTSNLATGSLVLGLFGFCVPIVGLAGIVCGHIGLSQIGKARGAVNGNGLAIAGLICGYLATLMWIGFGISVLFGLKDAQAAKKSAGELFDLAAVAVPAFPSLPEFEELEPGGVRVAQIDLPGTTVPGAGMSLRVYLPAGDKAPQARSLPCVLVAPAGTNLLSGASLGSLAEETYHDETLPYAEAGMVAVLYSIDGEDPEDAGDDDDTTTREMQTAYRAFEAAGAGTVNGRNALEFVLARLPMVDPGRIYSAGHSSAATLSLLFAEHEPRLRGCVAYAPAVDLEARFSEMLGALNVGSVLPGFRHFVKRSSPLTHTSRLTAPVFLFFADDDEMIQAEGYRPFIAKLRETNREVTLRTVPDGGHYQSMIDPGIPAGIQWIRKNGADLPSL